MSSYEQIEQSLSALVNATLALARERAVLQAENNLLQARLDRALDHMSPVQRARFEATLAREVGV